MRFDSSNYCPSNRELQKSFGVSWTYTWPYDDINGLDLDLRGNSSTGSSDSASTCDGVFPAYDALSYAWGGEDDQAEVAKLGKPFETLYIM